MLSKYDAGEKLSKDAQLLWLVTPLRFLILAAKDPNRWETIYCSSCGQNLRIDKQCRYKKCRGLSTNIEARKEQADFLETQARTRLTTTRPSALGMSDPGRTIDL